mgnify:CR=1 FL=1
MVCIIHILQWQTLTFLFSHTFFFVCDHFSQRYNDAWGLFPLACVPHCQQERVQWFLTGYVDRSCRNRHYVVGASACGASTDGTRTYVVHGDCCC